MKFDLMRRLAAEALGTFFLVMAVVGSGIMAEKLAGGNQAIALLCNTLPTGAVLFVIITIFVSVSGAQFNPAVTLVMLLRGEIEGGAAAAYVAAQIAGDRCLPISIYGYTPVTGVDDYALLAASFQAAVRKVRELKWIA